MSTQVNIDVVQKVMDLSGPIDISIPMRFDGPQPNAFGVEPATSVACKYGALVGDTRQGGSCNFERLTFIPHCNGTHTECVGHITNKRISVRECLQDVLIRALLVSVEGTAVGNDLVIGDGEFRDAGVRLNRGAAALIVRTLPNDADKLSRVYDENYIPPYFTTDAMEFIVAANFKHLLVDLPSIDRLYDDGKLINHRIFWNVEPGSFEINAATRIHSTITEMIYVPNEVEDDEYLLNLQIAPFESDATPSRPVLLKNI